MLSNTLWLVRRRRQPPRSWQSGAWALVWLMVLGWALGGLGADTALAEGRVALVIGNSTYQYARVLPNPKNDAEAIAGLLRQIGFAGDDVVLKLDLDYKSMRDEIRAFAGKAMTADVAIVYYAGHGIEVGGENYLVPVDAKLLRDRDLDYEAVTLNSVLDAVGEARKLKLVILDACRDNPLSHKISLKAGVTRKVTRGLETIEPQGDVLVAYAAKAGTVALDGTGKHSPFAEALMKHLPTPGVDVFRLFGKVTETVLDATKRQQEPWLYGRAGGEPIALVPELPKSELPKAAPPAWKQPGPELTLPPPPPPHPAASADGLSATESARICREVADITSLSVLGAMADQHKGTKAGPCIAARVAELTKAEAGRAKAEAEKRAEADKAKVLADASKAEAAQPKSAPAPKTADPPPAARAPVTECDRLAAAPDYAPAGLPGVPSAQIDTDRAVRACQEALRTFPGEARFQAWLGRSLKQLTNYGDARIWLEKAAEQGEATSPADLGWLFQYGKGVAIDLAKARAWYEKGAERGELTGMMSIANLYYTAQGGPRDYAKARHWYETAAERGHVQAMNIIGNMYLTDKGGAPDYAKALRWFEKAAFSADAAGMFNLGSLHYQGKGVPQSYATARFWLEKAAEAGQLNAMIDLGSLYQQGLGVPVNYAAAREWYEKAVARGSADAMNRIGVMHSKGEGVPQNYAEARSWYEKAIAKGDAAAIRNVALQYNTGLGVARNPQTAATYLLRAAQKGSTSARKDLAEEMQPWLQETRKAVQELLIASGDLRGPATGVWDQASRDAAKAYSLRPAAPVLTPSPVPASPPSVPATECDRLASAPGYAPPGVQGVAQEQINGNRAVGACYEAVQRYPDEPRFQAWLGRAFKAAMNYGDARIAFTKAAEKGEVTSMTNLGWLYQNGKGVPESNTMARIWYEKAAERGEPISMLNLARLYRAGQGVTQDYGKARFWFERAAEKGSAPAMNYLAVLLYEGQGGPPDAAKAIEWFKKAADLGEASAVLNIGHGYKSGKGVPQSYQEARAWFEKAAALDQLDALLEIAALYRDGLGVPQNVAIALQWYEKAAARGSAAAMNRIGVIYHDGKGVPQNFATARSWYERAMAKGDAAAMRNLAVMYAGGQGVQRNPQYAANLILSAARWRNPTARTDLDTDMHVWSQPIRRAVQELLIASRDLAGSATGIWDDASRDAAKAYYSRGG